MNKRIGRKIAKNMFDYSQSVKRLVTLAAIVSLAGCMFAPGMKFDDSALVSGDPDTIPTVTEITPEMVLRQQLGLNAATKSGKSGTNDVSLFGATPEYRIGPADILSIIVWDHPELVMPNLTYTIGSTSGAQPTTAGLATQTLPGYLVGGDGNIQFPYVNVIKVAGLTEREAKQSLQRQLGPFIREPQITLRVIGYRSKKVFVDGEVGAAGVKAITDVPMTLAEAINESGGILLSGNRNKIQLVRDNRTYTISLPDLSRTNQSAVNIPLKDGDAIHVPPLVEQRVMVMGEVIKPSAIPVKTDGRLTLGDAITDAGGIINSSSDPTGIYVVRPQLAGSPPLVFHLDAKSPTAFALAAQFQVVANDIIYVEAPNLVRWSRIISLLTGSASGANSISNIVK